MSKRKLKGIVPKKGGNMDKNRISVTTHARGTEERDNLKAHAEAAGKSNDQFIYDILKAQGCWDKPGPNMDNVLAQLCKLWGISPPDLVPDSVIHLSDVKVLRLVSARMQAPIREHEVKWLNVS